jgi:hypothetical protein
MWEVDAGALSLLEHQGPFSSAMYRRAVVETLDGWTDVSFGARTIDGTLAAIPLLASHRGADSMPPSGYGGVASTRSLTAEEEWSFIETARLACSAPRLSVRALGDPAEMPHRRFLASASVVRTDANPPAEQYARLARRSLKKSADAGAIVGRCESTDEFLDLYGAASTQWTTQYPDRLLTRLVSDGVARIDLVTRGAEPIAGLLTLVGESHWMCWLAAQNPTGRGLAASYLAYDAVFSDAHRDGIDLVNLGASVGGGAEFKRHLGAVEEPMYESGVSLMRDRPLAQARASLRRALRLPRAVARRVHDRS